MIQLPTRLLDWHCSMTATDDSRNMARSYRIATSRDLFGHIIVELGWGRIGRRGNGMTLSFVDEAAARGFVRRVLARRASAPRRIGTAYVPAIEG